MSQRKKEKNTNKWERVTAAFKGLETDHVPVCMWQHVPPDYWGDDDRFAQVQAKFLKDTDVDFMKLSGDKYFGSWFWANSIDTMTMATIRLMKQRQLMPNFKLALKQVNVLFRRANTSLARTLRKASMNWALFLLKRRTPT